MAYDAKDTIICISANGKTTSSSERAACRLVVPYCRLPAQFVSESAAARAARGARAGQPTRPETSCRNERLVMTSAPSDRAILTPGK